MRKFFQTLCKHKLCMSIGIMIIIIMFLSYVSISVGNLVSHNACDVSMLGSEMLCESGPDFKSASEDNIKMVETYTNRMEDKYLAGILRVFCKEYSPMKGFEKALKTLKKAKDSSQEECAKAIWLAGEQVEQYRMKAETFPNLVQLVLHKYQKVSDELVKDIKIALDESKKSLERFKKNPTLENAVYSCEDDRWTMLLLFLARAGYNSGHSKLFDDFQKIVKAAKESKENIVVRLPKDDPRKEFLTIISDSEQRRLKILEAMQANDMYTALELNEILDRNRFVNN